MAPGAMHASMQLTFLWPKSISLPKIATNGFTGDQLGYVRSSTLWPMLKIAKSKEREDRLTIWPLSTRRRTARMSSTLTETATTLQLHRHHQLHRLLPKHICHARYLIALCSCFFFLLHLIVFILGWSPNCPKKYFKNFDSFIRFS